ncbi:MAG: hypothetical protein LBT53_02005 [Puniceicoccales bacterium]|nr:hypothetical protein [Puniceicoccales bacterium]
MRFQPAAVLPRLVRVVSVLVAWRRLRAVAVAVEWLGKKTPAVMRIQAEARRV